MQSKIYNFGYVWDCEQFTSIIGYSSYLMLVNCGVGQGSFLVPMNLNSYLYTKNGLKLIMQTTGQCPLI